MGNLQAALYRNCPRGLSGSEQCHEMFGYHHATALILRFIDLI